MPPLASDGNAPLPSVAEVIRRTCADAVALASSRQVAAGAALTVAALQERIDTVRGAVTMAYPMGLPEWDVVGQLLDDPRDECIREQMGAEYIDPATASLWWAGKEFFRDQSVGDRCVMSATAARRERRERRERPPCSAHLRATYARQRERGASFASFLCARGARLVASRASPLRGPATLAAQRREER